MSIATIANEFRDELPAFRLSVDKYHEMAQAGIISPDDRLELLEGMLVQKMTKSPAHSLATALLAEQLRIVVPSGYCITSQEPVTLATSEPEPDAAVIRGAVRDYSNRHPGPREVILVAEVADSSLKQDRVFKKAIYAAAGIEIYWIVNLVDRRVEVYSGCTTSASGDEYAKTDFFGPIALVPLVIEGRKVAEIAVSDLLP
jgi:Uma2 family endonuclease